MLLLILPLMLALFFMPMLMLMPLSFIHAAIAFMLVAISLRLLLLIADAAMLLMLISRRVRVEARGDDRPMFAAYAYVDAVISLSRAAAAAMPLIFRLLLRCQYVRHMLPRAMLMPP